MFIKAHTARLNNTIILRADDIKTITQAPSGTTIETYNNDRYTVYESAERILEQIKVITNDK